MSTSLDQVFAEVDRKTAGIEKTWVVEKIDRNGSKHMHGMVVCDRCGGLGGSDAWKFTNWTCYKCGGTGKVEARWIERTPEYEAKLAERRRKKAEKAMAEQEAERAEQLAALEAWKKEQERQKALEEARKAVSQYVGQIGEKITVKGEFVKTAWFDFRNPFGQEERKFIYTFKDTDGNVFVWKTGSGRYNMNAGEPVEVTGTVKEHNEYKGEKQTVLLRCKFKKAGE